MKPLGALFKFIMNINTIWALMILIGFFICLVKWLTPASTVFDASILSAGENPVVFTVRDSGDETIEYNFVARLEGDRLAVEPLATETARNPPVIKSAGLNDEGQAWIRWTYKEPGKYAVSVAGTVVTGPKDKIINLKTFNQSVFDAAESGFSLAFGFVAVFVLFLGLMKVGEDAGIVQIVAKVFYPVIRFLFPDVPKNHPANGAILMNITTSVLGLGNAATPFGLKAMEHLEDLNKNKGVATNAQVMLLGYNTAGFAILPTTLIALRTSAGCSNPFQIIVPCMAAGASATLTALFLSKLLSPIFPVEAAAAELAHEEAQHQAKTNPKKEEEAGKEDKE